MTYISDILVYNNYVLIIVNIKYSWENKNANEYKIPTIIEEYPLKIGNKFPIIEVNTHNGIWSNNNMNKIVNTNNRKKRKKQK